MPWLPPRYRARTAPRIHAGDAAAKGDARPRVEGTWRGLAVRPTVTHWAKGRMALLTGTDGPRRRRHRGCKIGSSPEVKSYVVEFVVVEPPRERCRGSSAAYEAAALDTRARRRRGRWRPEGPRKHRPTRAGCPDRRRVRHVTRRHSRV